MYLLDTNVVSEMRKVKGGRGDAAFVAWLKQTEISTFYTSVVVLMELERGVLGMLRKDPKQGAALRVWLDTLVKELFAGRVLAINEATAAVCAGIHTPDRSPENDAWIAATAIQHGLTLVTRNTRDYERTGARLIDPFLPSSTRASESR